MTKIIFATLFVVCFTEVCIAEECKNYDSYCHKMILDGACKWNLETRKACPRSCQSCKVSCPKIRPEDRQDCGYKGITYQDCYHAGCCWDALSNDSQYPWCYKPNASSN